MNFAERLRAKISYDPATCVFTWRETCGGKVAGSIAGSVDPADGYIRIGFEDSLYLGQRLAWVYMTGEWPSSITDHRNGNRADNSWENLREATWLENSHNRKRPSTNRSGHLGVCWHARSGAWRAQIQAKGCKIHLGTFPTAEEASAAYLAAKRELHPFQPAPRQDIAA
ncbi:HNH endonuclease [Mesorhizobium sp. M4B.F.Ca.ET.058.02.1.1]|uniref:HNH endonuclease n=1 Tax=Mesorhizobium sp. M4B.F.Ca.ET.058.02.1.1 TaxID=2493675 RepID=UPI000F75A412|nr:HNH endonuclease [Mesorhizobium sp. M4B.F.Ca.ET.058.02.1.1]AZO51252.1 HNH endonuclease [Mesorhizobium sp. M4B.F.Ca.ET.058.02.1.1]